MTLHGRTALETDIVLRRAHQEDRPAIDAMHALSVRALGAADYTPAQVALFLKHLSDCDPRLIEDGTYFVLALGDLIVGSGGWSSCLPAANLPSASNDEVGDLGRYSLSPCSARVRSVFVHPDVASLGLGARLVRHVESEAVAAGHRLLELWATLTGVPLYRKLGYKEMAPMTIPAGAGGGLPAVHMAKLVSADDLGASAA